MKDGLSKDIEDTNMEDRIVIWLESIGAHVGCTSYKEREYFDNVRYLIYKRTQSMETGQHSQNMLSSSNLTKCNKKSTIPSIIEVPSPKHSISDNMRGKMNSNPHILTVDRSLKVEIHPSIDRFDSNTSNTRSKLLNRRNIDLGFLEPIDLDISPQSRCKRSDNIFGTVKNKFYSTQEESHPTTSLDDVWDNNRISIGNDDTIYPTVHISTPLTPLIKHRRTYHQ